MANKRRPRQIKAPYKKYTGGSALESAKDSDATDEDPDGSQAASTSSKPELVLLSRQTKSRTKHHHEVSIGDSLLPLEILSIIAGYSEAPESLLCISKMWYLAALPYVYQFPDLSSRNFPSFVDALSNDKVLGNYVETLDLTGIVQSGKNSSTARLLRRCSYKLETFVAPQSQFGMAPLIALRGCHQLRVLDLSLVSETVDLPQVFTALKEMQSLEVMNFPRSSVRCDRYDFSWPPNLRSLGIAGGISAEFLEECQLPKTITRLHFSNCPFMTTEALHNVLFRVGPQLKHLAVSYPLPLVDPLGLDIALMTCPSLLSLSVSVDYTSKRLLDQITAADSHPLRSLSLISTGMAGHTEKLKPSAVLLATESLADLKRVSVSVQLGWNANLNEAVAGLAEVLDDRGGGLWIR